MKILTLNFLTCARKSCKSSPAAFPLHPREAELEIVEMEFSPSFIKNILPRVEWDALRGLCSELGLPDLPESPPEVDALFQNSPDDAEASEQVPSKLMEDLHNLLLQTTIQSGKLVCGNCDHEYAIKEGIANFLLPSHLV